MGIFSTPKIGTEAADTAAAAGDRPDLSDVTDYLPQTPEDVAARAGALLAGYETRAKAGYTAVDMAVLLDDLRLMVHGPAADYYSADELAERGFTRATDENPDLPETETTTLTGSTP